MKANELMIGDWVEYFSKYKHGIGKIAGIEPREGSVEPTTFTVIDDNFMFIGVSRVNVVPIPLTPEILEKNGFTHSFGDSDFYDYEKWEKKVDDKTIRVIKDHDGWFCRIDDKKLTRSMGISPAVHTMQNIIRIGGIENEIELEP